MLFVSQLRSKGQSGQPMPHTTSLSKPSQVASEWAPSLQPTSQRPQPALVSERSVSEAAEEAPLVEDEGFFPFFAFIYLYSMLFEQSSILLLQEIKRSSL